MSRRWLEEEQRWSCRMKLPDSVQDDSNSALNANPKKSAAIIMDQSSHMASDRRNGEMSAAIQSISNLDDDIDNLDLPSDPDAQATVTDFLDFTEYLPSDMMRSLTLIADLDKTYLKASSRVHELTKHYGQLPLPAGLTGPSAVNLRAEISKSLQESVNVRTLAYAEADRMAEHVDRHYNRAQNIFTKLQAMKEAYPESREPSPVPQPGTPRAVRTPKITLCLDGARSANADQGTVRVQKRRAPRITVPGEVLAPYEFDYESAGSDGDDSSTADDEPPTPRYTPARTLVNSGGRIKLTLPKNRKIKTQKAPRAPRPPGVMGTNVHSSVAGISTSNALAQLAPPPENAVKGSEDAPWLRLTEWELAKLRKRMKKNAIWNPSDTMIARELKILKRGIEDYRKERDEAEATGQPFEPALPARVDDGSGKQVVPVGALDIGNLNSADVQLSNRGMKLNEAKKLKKETQAKELAKLAAEEAEESARKMAEAASAMRNLFNRPNAGRAAETPSKPPTKTPAKKRKRESTADTNDTAKDSLKVDGESSQSAIKPQQKRSKVETPVPAPRSSAGSLPSNLPIALVSTTSSESIPAAEITLGSTGPSSAATITTTTIVPLRGSSPKKTPTPILPPTKDSKPKKPVATPAVTTRRRTSAAPTPTPAPEALSTRRASSRPASRPASRGMAASVEPPTAGRDRPRRASTAHTTPAPEVHSVRVTGKRVKRPAPGPVTASGEGSAAVSVGKRSAAPRKKVGPKKQQKDEEKDAAEIWDEIDDEGNVIDPDEPRYCSCNRVSFGTMICCENTDCEKEWFHLECVGLTAIPPRTTKWYCPDCRVFFGIGEKGEITARGKKK